MTSTEIAFKVVKEINCPYYKADDEFKLSGNALSLELEKEQTFISTTIVRFPNDRTSCRIFIGDLNNLLVQYKNIDRIPPVEMECSGCSGNIRVLMVNNRRLSLKSLFDSTSEKNDLIASLLSNFSIFESIDEYNIRAIVPLLKIKRYPKGAFVLRKGAPAKNLYIMLSGTVEVLDDSGICLSGLSKGDVFGEMSLISGDPVGATIKVVKPASIVAIEGSDFKDIINRYPSIQMYLARLLTKRLAASNDQRNKTKTSGMSGNLSQMSVTELLQALELAQKNGTLTLTLPRGSAQMLIKNGNLIRADYCNETGKEAVFEILMENEGQFNFSPDIPEDDADAPKIGSLMEILLDASRMIDEEVSGSSCGISRGGYASVL